MGRQTVATFVLMDVVGSVRLWEADEARMSAALVRLESIVDRCAAMHGGTVHKKRGEGDSFFLTFPNPRDALLASADFQLFLASEPWETSDPIRVRVAVRTGSAEERNGDFFGPTVNRCARMRSALSNGQVIVCQACRAMVRDEDLDGLALVEAGTFRMKDLPDAERLYLLAVPGIDIDRHAIRIDEAGSSNVPPRLTSFVGREREMGAATDALRRQRLVTLTGAGGSGKTRLSMELADHAGADYVDGVWFLPLVDCSDEESLCERIVKELGSVAPGMEPNRDGVAQGLASRHLLLVFDNCEHVLSPAAKLARHLLTQCPHLRILATSRIPLGIVEENVVPVAPLRSPDLDDDLSLEEAQESPAVKLFLDRARSRDPDFCLTAANARSVASICSHLDGIPLAIEQAASHAGKLSAAQIEDRLGRRFRLLQMPVDSMEARHATMRATIEWSVDLLSPPARELFFRLGVFAGGWTLEGAEAIGGDSDEVFDAHGELVDASLVQRSEDPAAGARYRFLETVREFVLDVAPVGEDLRRLHLDWMMVVAEKADVELIGPNQTEWIRRMELERENLRLAVEFADATGDGRFPTFANFLKRYWWRLGYYREGANWLERALAHPNSGEPRLRATLLNALGACRWRLGEWDEAEARYAESFELWKAIGDDEQMAALYVNRAICATEREDYVRAEELYALSCDCYRRVGNDRGLGSTLMNLGHMRAVLGNDAAAITVLEESIDLLRRAGHLSSLAYALGNIGLVRWRMGRKDEFFAAAEEHIEIIGSTHDPASAGYLALDLGSIGIRLESMEVVRRAAEISASIFGPDPKHSSRFYQQKYHDIQAFFAQRGIALPKPYPAGFEEHIPNLRALLEAIRAADGGSA